MRPLRYFFKRDRLDKIHSRRVWFWEVPKMERQGYWRINEGWLRPLMFTNLTKPHVTIQTYSVEKTNIAKTMKAKHRQLAKEVGYTWKR